MKFSGRKNELVGIHELGHRGRHDAGQRGANAGHLFYGRSQQEILQRPDRPVRNARERRRIDVVIHAHHGIYFAAPVEQRSIIEMLQRQLGQQHARCFAFEFAARRQAGVAIAGLGIIGRGEQFFQPGERNTLTEKRLGIDRLVPSAR